MRYPVSYAVLAGQFQVPERYRVVDAIGQGAYGVVCSARDTETGEMVAIKKIEKAFEHTTFAKRTLRELKLLRIMVHENILRITTILPPPDPGRFDDIYVVSELMETDLSCIIKSDQPLTEEHVQFFVYQVLRGLKYLHSSNILHRDLKPRNLLVNSNCDLKICDFGLARVLSNVVSDSGMTDYVATRWYRAPELILASREYSASVDMWAVGCVLGELITRRALFPGSDSHHQLELVTDLLGPTPEAMSPSTGARHPSSRSSANPAIIGKKEAKPLDIVLPNRTGVGRKAFDLLRHLLCLQPAERYTAAQALEHPFLAALHWKDDEPEGTPIDPSIFAFESFARSAINYRKLVLDEISDQSRRGSACSRKEADASPSSSSKSGPSKARHEETPSDPSPLPEIEEPAVPVVHSVAQEPPKAEEHTNRSSTSSVRSGAKALSSETVSVPPEESDNFAGSRLTKSVPDGSELAKQPVFSFYTGSQGTGHAELRRSASSSGSLQKTHRSSRNVTRSFSKSSLRPKSRSHGTSSVEAVEKLPSVPCEPPPEEEARRMPSQSSVRRKIGWRGSETLKHSSSGVLPAPSDSRGKRCKGNGNRTRPSTQHGSGPHGVTSRVAALSPEQIRMAVSGILGSHGVHDLHVKGIGKK